MQPTEGFPYRKTDRRRKADRWYAVLTVNGKRQYHAATPNTRDGAKALLRELQRDRQAGVIDSRDLTLGQYLQSWLETVRPLLAPATWKQHESICRLYLQRDLGHHRLSDLSVGVVRSYLGRHHSLDPQTLRHHRATLRRALADAETDGYVVKNVAAQAKPPKLDRKERPVLSADEARRLIDGTRDDRLWAFWTLLVTTGLREAEALGLQWEDVDHMTAYATGAGSEAPSPTAGKVAPTGGQVSVRHTLHWLDGQPVLMEPKTPKSRRTIPLTDIAVEALTEHRRRQLEERMRAGKPGRDGMVFTNQHGYPYRGENMSAAFHKVTARIGLPRVNPHDLRHTAATIWLLKGMPVEQVSRLLGHSSIRVTIDTYFHLLTSDLRSAASVMQEAVG